MIVLQYELSYVEYDIHFLAPHITFSPSSLVKKFLKIDKTLLLGGVGT